MAVQPPTQERKITRPAECAQAWCQVYFRCLTPKNFRGTSCCMEDFCPDDSVTSVESVFRSAQTILFSLCSGVVHPRSLNGIVGRRTSDVHKTVNTYSSSSFLRARRSSANITMDLHFHTARNICFALFCLHSSNCFPLRPIRFVVVWYHVVSVDKSVGRFFFCGRRFALSFANHPVSCCGALVALTFFFLFRTAVWRCFF